MIFEKQQFQEDCVENIVKVLEGIDDFNDLSALKSNIKALHKDKEIPATQLRDENRLDILMETGTGKTFTYLKTMFELNKQFDVNRFIVFVPRTAIRAGVIYAIKATRNYFYNEYRKDLKIHSYTGDGKMSSIDDYVRSDNLSVLILTSSSIASQNRNNRKLTAATDSSLYGRYSRIEAIGKLKPVIFIDEPHLLQGEVFTETYNKYFPDSLLLRFGATFRGDLSNTSYILDSISAFRQHLVKRIQVTTIIDGSVGIKFYNQTGKGKNKSVSVLYFKDNIEYKKTVSINSDIGSIIGDPKYTGIYIVNIDDKNVYLSNKEKYSLKENYDLKEDSIRRMIRATIESHFEKEECLFKQGIKTLSLFFIPRINDFKGDDPRVKNIFEKEYIEQRRKKLDEKLSAPYREYLNKDYSDNKLSVHGGYFSNDKGTKEKQEIEGVNLILNEKEKLLSTQTSLRFIFSVWALQEGWDNPNIFQICKLASSNQETSRRQQVGRGLRLAINQDGKRQTVSYLGDGIFYNINTLDVIVSGQEKNFIEEIQKEIEINSYDITLNNISIERLKANGLNEKEAALLIVYLDRNDIISFNDATGNYSVNYSVIEFLESDDRPPLPTELDNKLGMINNIFSKITSPPVRRASQGIGIRKEQAEEFKKLWGTITQKAKIFYNDIADDIIIEKIVTDFGKESIPPLQAIREVKYYDSKNNEIVRKSTSSIENIKFFDRTKYESFILDFTKSEKLPLTFVRKLFSKLDKEKIRNNPKQAKAYLAQFTADNIHRNIIQNVSYGFNSEVRINAYNILYNDDGSPKKSIQNWREKYADEKAKPPSEYLYDKIIYDSAIEREAISNNYKKVNGNKIVVFAKLPPISIPTPYKKYNPDFAYFIKNSKGKQLFLIVETKGYERQSDIADKEKTKIKYAEKFFKKLNADLPDINVRFETRINQQGLIDLLNEVVQ